jgi:toxin ParE1/3/4
VRRRILRRAQAKRDISRHFAYLAEHADITVARRFVRAIHSASRMLAEMPELGVRRPFKKKRLANVRMWPVREFRQFLIFYEPVEDGIRLLRIIHAKQDYPRVLQR